MDAACGGPAWRLSTLHAAWFLLYLKQTLECTMECQIPRNLKLTPEMLLDKRCWLMTSSPWSQDPCVFYRLETILWCQRRQGNNVINHLLLSRGFTGESFRLRHWILRYNMVLAFPCKSWPVSFDCLKIKIFCASALRMISKRF